MKVVLIFVIFGTIVLGARDNGQHGVAQEDHTRTNNIATVTENVGRTGLESKSVLTNTQTLSRTKRQYPFYPYPVILPIFFGGGFGGYGYGFGGRGFGGRGFGGRGFGGRGFGGRGIGGGGGGRGRG